MILSRASLTLVGNIYTVLAHACIDINEILEFCSIENTVVEVESLVAKYHFHGLKRI
jgi:hypothetical protein